MSTGSRMHVNMFWWLIGEYLQRKNKKISSEKRKLVCKTSENNFLCLRLFALQKPDAYLKKEEKQLKKSAIS